MHSIEPSVYFAIRVVDEATGRGIPLVEFRTTDETRYITDSNGYVAFHEPGLMDRRIWFDVASWGYESPSGSFGTKGVVLETKAGSEHEIKLSRNNLAERLYRQTGVGIYRDSMLLGKPIPMNASALHADVSGCDSIQTAIYKGKMRWFWQDTDQIGFALGNYSMTGATSALPNQLDPDRGIQFDYFQRSDGLFARPMARVKQTGNLPIWVDGLMVVNDATGEETMVARYVAAEKDFSVAQCGLMRYDDEQDVFVELKSWKLPTESKLYPHAHPVKVDVDGTEYFYIGTPPNVRVEANYDSIISPSQYEGLTCLRPDGTVDRGEDGKPKFSWRKTAEPIDEKTVARLMSDEDLSSNDVPFALTDIATKRPVRVATGSIAWNAFLQKWTLLFCQQGGDSFLGEVWFATANSPEGPWVHCQKVATHARDGQNMDFYNPKQHPELAKDSGRFVYFEGTFVNTFSGTSVPVPRYNYNQLMYRLDVTDSRLQLPEPAPALQITSEPTELILD